MDDIFEYLRNDHKKVANLFHQFIHAHSQQQQADIFSLIHRELTLHAESEEETFYRALQANKKSKKDVLHSQKEHTEIKTLLATITKVRSVYEQWLKKIIDLKGIVDHHVAEEEGKIFDEAREVLTKQQTIDLREQMHDYKEKMLESMEV